MLSFVTSQAIALSRIQAKEGKLAEVSQGRVGVAPHGPKSPFKRLLAALFETRISKAARETQVHRRIDRDNFNT
jgi:hypothetical protein